MTQETPRILVVDGEPGLRQYLRMVLERAGYKVAEAQDGNEALKVAHRTRIHLLITDLVMPNKE